MNFSEKILAILKDANKPLKSSQILTLLKRTYPKLKINKKELNQIIWNDLRQKIIYNTTDYTIILKDTSIETNSYEQTTIDFFNHITKNPTNLFELTNKSESEIKLSDILNIITEEKIRLGTHEANLLAENITIRLKNKYGSN
jgi:hypothetical protein